MNTCVSRLGSNQLKAWLFQPINDVAELRRRHRMIEWCRNEKNAVNLTKFRASLMKLVNAGELYAKLIRSRGKPSVWKIFKRSLFYANDIANICKALLRSNTADVIDTVIEDYGKYSIENTQVFDLLQQIDTIIDLDESIVTGNFTVRRGLDTGLDAKKDEYLKGRDELQVLIRDDLQHFPSEVKEITCSFLPEMGFLMGKFMMKIYNKETLKFFENYYIIPFIIYNSIPIG